jgi:hypothetical protein
MKHNKLLTLSLLAAFLILVSLPSLMRRIHSRLVLLMFVLAPLVRQLKFLSTLTTASTWRQLTSLARLLRSQMSV